MAESATDIRARRPGAAPTSTERQPLGVPADYTAPGQMPSQIWGNRLNMQPVPVAPRYFVGDEWRPASLPPNRIAELQQDMVDAGLLSGTFRIGVWDNTSRTAYQTLLETANASGVDAPSALDSWRAGGAVDTEPEAPRQKRAPLRIDASNPETLKATFQRAARGVQGRKLDDATLGRMVTAYQAAEAAPQQQAYAMGGDIYGDNPTGGTVVDAIDPGVFAEQQAREADPLRADSRKVVKQFGALAGMLGEGGILQTGGV